VHEIRPGIQYIDLDRISDDDFRQATPALAKAKAIIFDLRGYPRCGTAFLRHLTDQPISSARWNIPQPVLPDRQDLTFEEQSWTLQPEAPRFTSNVAFLTDERAISYAETVMGIVEHYKLAAIVGSATAGTNGNVNPFALPGGYRVAWTGMKVLKHDRSQHHGIGIQPTVPITRTIAGVAKGRDEVLERAIELVTSRAKPTPVPTATRATKPN